MNSQVKSEETYKMASLNQDDNLPEKGGLVIESNTIYEIDEDCLECLRKERKH